MLLVTGGAGFIGANFVLQTIAATGEPIVNLDKLTYAGNVRNLDALRGDARHALVRGDVCDRALVRGLLERHRPRALVHFAAESHVDRSIHAPGEFVQTNVVGTFGLLEEARAYWMGLPEGERRAFRFLHVSTDEVYGSLGPGDAAFTESTPYAPNSPYSASKAGADHLVRAWHHTYGLPTLTTNCSNNYGPYQHPEKLIPLMILSARAGRPLPVYGDGRQVRDWLYVEDHCAAIRAVLDRGRTGETYNVGGYAERTNLEIVHALCRLLDERFPENAPHARLVTHVADRPGHDRRYAIDAAKIERALGWRPAMTFEQGMARTVQWYLDHDAWVRTVSHAQHQEWLRQNYQAQGRGA